MKFIADRPQSWNGCMFVRNRFGKGEFYTEDEKTINMLKSLRAYKDGQFVAVEETDVVVADEKPAPSNGTTDRLPWPALKKKAKEAGVKVLPTMKRKDIEKALAEV